MTKIERMTAAFNHQEADKVPKGELCIEALFANRVLDSNYPLDYQHYERDKKIRKRLHIDFINVGDWPSDEIGHDAHGNTLYRSIYGYEYATNGVSKHITKPSLVNIEDAEKYPVPDIKKVSGALIKKYRDATDLYVMGQIGGPVSMLDEMFEMEDYMVYTMTNTAEMRILGEKIMEHEIEKAKLFIDSGAHAVLVADDIAFNSGLFLPPRIMNEIVYPFYKITVQEIKKHKDVPIIFHSDGYMMDALDTLVEVGFSGIQSIQPSAGMDIREVKRRYGKDLCLIGNIDLDEIMTFAEPEVVERVVKETIDIAAPGGGFVLSTCNTLVNAIPADNGLAMYETAETYGIY